MRDAERQTFLEKAGWGDAAVSPLAGDASHRRYFRITDKGRVAVLMDAPPETNSDTPVFLRIGAYLAGLGLSAPRVLTSDLKTGFVLLEDLGDDLFSTVLTRDTSKESELYDRATDVLIALAKAAPPEDAPTYNLHTMLDRAALPYEWYAPGDAGPLRSALRPILAEVLAERQSLALRDYHMDNLIWLPERDDVQAVGLLDFQDAGLCHPAYDLISLIRDVRRDVPHTVQDRQMQRFADALSLDRDGLERAAATLSAQRNLRILGVFARLSKRDGKPRYLDFLPRVWRLLSEDIAHPALAPLREVVQATLPEPSPEHIEALR